MAFLANFFSMNARHLTSWITLHHIALMSMSDTTYGVVWGSDVRNFTLVSDSTNKEVVFD